MSRNVVANTKALVSAARKAGVAIVHAQLIVDPARRKGWLAHLTFGRVFTQGTWKSAITDGLLAHGDGVAHDRYAFDGQPERSRSRDSADRTAASMSDRGGTPAKP